MTQERRFYNANEAFVVLFRDLHEQGVEEGNETKRLMNIGFYIDNPKDNRITVEWRRWSKRYADREWNWYLSGDRSVTELKKYAPIWDKMHGGDDIVNSNYGYLWNEYNQLRRAVKQIRKDKYTRQAWVSLFDGKRKSQYIHDTPCTLNLGFKVVNDKLCMTVFMRSNDLWYGFCNDQYCFSNLQQFVARETGYEVGWYYHHAADMHIYEGQYYADRKYYENMRIL